MRMWIAAVVAFGAAMASGALAAADERQDLIAAFAATAPSVGALYALEAGGDFTFLCSATAVDRHDGQTVILTAYHCARKGVSYLINFGDNVLRPVTVWQVPHYEVDAVESPRVFNEPQTDMALFLMDGVDVPVVPLAEASALAYGAKVAMVGFPLGLSKIMYEGIIAGRLDRPGNDMHGYLLLQIFGAPGSSGSAVIDVATGRVVGVLVGGSNVGAGLPVIFATPIEYRAHLMPVLPDMTVGVAAPAATAR
ncbi:MAG: S1 family peptidase [Alphaproteobacteria bacterium]